MKQVKGKEKNMYDKGEKKNNNAADVDICQYVMTQ
jgi:hypothetical protein